MFKRLFLSCALICCITSSALALTKRTFDFVVGKDGDFKAAMTAAASTASSSHRFYIFFPDGNYNVGSLTGNSNQLTTFPTSYVSFVGQSTNNTVLYNANTTEGISVTATLYIYANSIYMQDMTIYNKTNYGQTSTYSATGRYVAIQQQGDKFIYKNVKLLSTQDTYYTKKGSSSLARTYWEDGEIHGTTDFICGDGDVFFNRCTLHELKKSAMTAASTTSDFGYVFDQCTIESDVTGYTLGRSWNYAKTVFLNTTMNVVPIDSGWMSPINYVPKVFAEYNSKNSSGGSVNLSKRKTSYTDKNGGSATLNPILSSSEAANYTISNVLSGTDSWNPEALAAQVSSPVIVQSGSSITWNTDANALCWVVFKNGIYLANVSTNSYDASSLSVGDVITVRAANEMGGLGESSNSLTISDQNATYYSVIATAAPGGSVSQSPTGTSIAEGSALSITATPVSHWNFSAWSGDYTSSDNVLSIASLASNVNVQANFVPTDKFTYQAETGSLKNAVTETKNAGYAGAGYVNFSTGISADSLPVYMDSAGTVTVIITYSNGSGASRSLAVSVNGGTATDVDFAATADWTTWSTVDITLTLPAGASMITFATVNSADGPNLDQIVLNSGMTKVKPKLSKLLAPLMYNAKDKALYFNLPRNDWKALLYSMDGRELVNATAPKSLDLSLFKSGVYMVKVTYPGYSYSRTFRLP